MKKDIHKDDMQEDHHGPDAEVPRFVVVIGSGLYRDKPTNRFPEGRPHHKPIYIVWDNKPGKKRPHGEMICHEEDRAVADRKCDRLNKIEKGV